MVTDTIIQRGLTFKGAFGVDAPAQRKAIEIIESGRFLWRSFTPTPLGWKRWARPSTLCQAGQAAAMPSTSPFILTRTDRESTDDR
ncbi:hypothetical protein [Nesterenkonia pannonica]|uniref:hypothetical protein n=1 Tax=Nesterenkonia pannonica TaxID=1548602 RepID=UPI0021649631|nr:hypothetical protein [Nesterenkonia pannonica]